MITLAFVVILMIIRLLMRGVDDETIVARVLEKHPGTDEGKLRKAIKEIRKVLHG